MFGQGKLGFVAKTNQTLDLRGLMPQSLTSCSSRLAAALLHTVMEGFRLADAHGLVPARFVTHSLFRNLRQPKRDWCTWCTAVLCVLQPNSTDVTSS
jgi:hypothetical protein